MLFFLYLISCTLGTEVRDPAFVPASVNNAPAAPDLASVYQNLDMQRMFDSNELSSDIAAGPTRGTDWYDGGVHQQYQLHTWTASHSGNRNTWNSINASIYTATLVAETKTGQTQAEGKFIRALASFLSCDLYGQVQHRPASAPVDAFPDVFTREQATDYIISELEAAIPHLPAFDGANRGIATKEAAKFLLAKTYLNKAVYKQNPKQPEGPFTFAAADMNKVIQFCDEIDANPHLGYSANYWDNLKWDNTLLSKENIFVSAAANGTKVTARVCVSVHYNMTPSGWNGFVILPAFYDTFEDGDIRKKYNIPGYSEYIGYNAGFLIGQAYAPKGTKKGNNKAGPGIPLAALEDRSGSPLKFTRDFSLYASSEEKGIRFIKFPLSLENCNSSNNGWNAENDFPVFRYADMRLMKAEAILRGGSSDEQPLAIVNELRRHRYESQKASALSAVDLAVILAERGRELYLEGWRRPDLVRFGKYLEPHVPEQKTPTPGYRVVFPIPDVALPTNPNLKQNFGY